MFVKSVEKLLNKLSIYEKDFLFQFLANNKECPASFYVSYPHIPKLTPVDTVGNNSLLDITNKDITIIKKAVKSLDGIKLKYYTINYKFFNTENTNAYIKITTREEEDIYLFL